MRELRGAGVVTVKHVGTEVNPADLFTKVLARQGFERHRRSVLNLAAHDVIESKRAARVKYDEAASDGVAAFAADRAVRAIGK